ncbi:MAG: S-layer homology domain-containing protein [Clostridia bacterium]|nr:S-layer homology domain-containing protein [Clostridia bacterium]
MEMRGIRKKFLSVIMAVIFTVGLMPVWTIPVQAEDGLSVSGTDGGYTYDESGNVTITQSGTYTITGTGDTTSSKISVTSGAAVSITLDNVNIDVSSTTSSAFTLEGNNDVDLTLSGSNTLISGDNYAGLQVSESSQLTINGDGSLSATGGIYAAGIGGSDVDYERNCGRVTITGGTVKATGGTGAADIGIASGGSSDVTLTITGGSVNAERISASTVYYNTYHSTSAYLTKVTVGKKPFASQEVLYEIGNGCRGIKTSTDENGILYLWLPESSSTTVTVFSLFSDASYECSGAVAANYDNELTADILPIKITALPKASNVYSGSALSASTLTEGFAICYADNTNREVYGKFSWTNPDTIVTSSGNYSVTFTPNCEEYESITCMVYVIVKNGSGTTELSINDHSINISMSGDYRITGTGEQTSNTISVARGVKGVNITLDNVNIDGSDTNDGALVLEYDNDVRLTLAGDNILKSSFGYAGIQVNSGSSLTISGDGSLTATGGEQAAGIGASCHENGDCGSITINGGTVIANGGYRAAGIGGNGLDFSKNSGNITINGGTTVAVGGGDGAADIGGGYKSSENGTLTITGGSVKANSIDMTVYYNTDQKTPAYLTKVTVGLTPVASENVTYTINGGSNIKTSTDENGMLYLWLPQNYSWDSKFTTIDVTADNTVYDVSSIIAASNYNKLTALLVTKITTPPTASDIVTASKLSASTLTGGKAEDENGETLTGKFTWTNPDNVVGFSNKYSVTFTPDNSNYESVILYVPVSINAKKYSINDGSVEINENGSYIISGTGEPTSNTIKVDRGLNNVCITLNNVNIDASDTNSSALSLEFDDYVYLMDLYGDNIFKGGSLGAGIKVDSTSWLYIYDNLLEDEPSGTLTAVGGDKAAGIGGSGNASDNSCGTIISSFGFINATGGSGAAGIGGGAGGNGGDIKILGGSTVAKGGDGAADIGHGAGNSNDGSIVITCGSVKADNIGPSTVYYDYDKTVPAYLTKVKLGVNPVKSQYFDYTCDSSTGSVSSSTDENGMVYLWLPESDSAKLYIEYGDEFYTASGAIKASNDNTLTAMATCFIAELPTASSVGYNSKLSDSKLSGGAAMEGRDKEITGKFTWDNPDTIIKKSGDYYSVTFTPDNPNYKCATAKVKVFIEDDDDDDNPNSGGGAANSGGGSPASNTSDTTVVSSNGIETNAAPNSDGTATANVTDNQISQALNEATANQEGNEHTLEIKVSGSSSDISTVISNAALENITNSGITSLNIDTPVGSVAFNSTALESIEENAGDNVGISISKADTSSFSSEERAEIGDRPVYELTLTSNGKTISDFGDGTATVSIPYTLKDGENPSEIVVYYVADSGDLITVPDCVYDASTGMVTFKTTHFSNYMIGYNNVGFNDVSGWYKDYVDFLAARGIMNGVGDNSFKPNDNITRAQFVTILANLSGDDLSKYAKSSFTDVSNTDWYFAPAQWAYNKGIVKGTDGNFNPNADITREQMAAMLYNYAKSTGIDVSTAEGMVREFSDYESISDWAVTPVDWAVNLGIFSGDDTGNFRPKASATRAEAAKVIAVFLQDMIK